MKKVILIIIVVALVQFPWIIAMIFKAIWLFFTLLFILTLLGGFAIFLLIKKSGINKEYFEYKNFSNKDFDFDSANNFKDKSKYYKELGIENGASIDEVKRAYKNLARKYHPDFHESKTMEEKLFYEKKFKEINEAYENLK